MTVAQDLRDEARRIVDELRDSTPRLKQELSRIEARKLEIVAVIGASDSAHARLSNFTPEIQGKFQCPSCWIHHEILSPLRPLGGATSSEEYLKCTQCDQEFTTYV